MSPKPSSAVKPFPALPRSRRLSTLWMLRILINSGANEDLFSHPRFASMRNTLKLPVLGEDEDPAALWQRLTVTLDRMEADAESMRLPAVLQSNLALLGKWFSFDEVERLILALAILLRIDDALFQAADCSRRSVNAPEALSKVLRIPASRIAKAFDPSSRLRRSNLVDVSSGGDIAQNLRLRRGGLRKLGERRLTNVDELFDGMLTCAPRPSLVPGDFMHLKPDFETLSRFLSDALKHGRKGVNVLLYGSPGTGKSELVRVLSKQLDVPLFDVADVDENGDALRPDNRLAGAVTGLFLLGKRRVLVCFDEVEAIFNDGSRLFGKPSTAESQKLFFNRLLENNKAPVFWIANGVHGIDPAFARRFDLVIRLESPPRGQRLKLLERKCSTWVPAPYLRKLSQLEQITPAIVARASSVVKRMKPKDQAASEILLETVLDSVLQVQRHPSLKVALRGTDAGGFDPELCNAGTDLRKLADGLSKSETGRLCLYGPPGTGKTAFGHWLAERLDKPLVLKRVSDLQSPWLGQMEKNLAEAFEQARRDGAILQIDEVDSFLQDRRQAERSWEISQVNEFLTQLESFDGLFIASTNLMNNLDQAALRRFDYKLRMDFLRPEQALALLERHLSALGLGKRQDSEKHAAKLRALKLVPGDYAVVARRHRVVPFADAAAVIEALGAEASFRQPPARSIGFV